MIGTLAERYWDKVVMTGEDECWGWNASTNPFGYGKISIGDNKLAPAHRVSWEIHNGPIPKGLLVLHKCDNPPCTNPKHLFLGTYSDNSLDMHAKGRNAKIDRKGEKGNNVKLKESQVLAIRQDKRTYKEICREYGIGTSQVWNIKSKQAWSHI